MRSEEFASCRPSPTGWTAKTTYALEGSIFVAGAAVQWLRDGIKVIGKAAESGELAARADDTQDVYLVPAFTGLGAPHWDAESTRGDLRADPQYRTLRNFAAGSPGIGRPSRPRDLLDAMRKDWKGGEAGTVLRVDGGMVASDWTMQRLADYLEAPVDRPTILETTALGAGMASPARRPASGRT